MSSYENCVEYRNVIMGSCPVQVGPVEDWYTVQIVAPNVLRLTRERQIELGRKLWRFAGKDVNAWDAAPEEQRWQWSRSHMGRYKFVEIFDESNDIYSYRRDSGLGGNYDKKHLMVVND